MSLTTQKSRDILSSAPKERMSLLVMKWPSPMQMDLAGQREGLDAEGLDLGLRSFNRQHHTFEGHTVATCTCKSNPLPQGALIYSLPVGVQYGLPANGSNVHPHDQKFSEHAVGPNSSKYIIPMSSGR